ncbi:RlpA-like double-psi beta-barrel-protein domain-containing protein-containing protein [Fomitopsis serialis]|uniref:RlpA-like double-psi beta-barrel-protein domain-containing protein-containing protein n=1 Tax=Fomitopsis serialis TaxID=139415 RepID=UPI0020082E91|nr:RlpA-like double-psi beta-barrel-protein domain-containing protein-containing protein [Neoantrodia serialis]KAH9921657.1 RlpA-like double-psi beta-barrel-protein domain-containing protein-containing protein [Neoantrodia serialis]
MYSTIFAFCVLQLIVQAARALPLKALGKRDDYQGDATYFETGTGACGYTDNDSDPIVAISHLIYGEGGNCNQWIQITNPANGQSQYGQVRDECEGCGQYNIDLSPSLFQSLGEDLSVGRFGVDWHYMDKNFSP